MTSGVAISDSIWGRVRHFGPREFPEGILKYMDARVIFGLDEFRERLGAKVYPSPLPGGWARFTGSEESRHYAVGRLSDAGDVFPEGRIQDAWRVAVEMGVWGGIGVYFDTVYGGRPHAMLHLDLRPRGPRGALWWARMKVGGRPAESKYIYPVNGPADAQKFFSALALYGMERTA